MHVISCGDSGAGREDVRQHRLESVKETSVKSVEVRKVLRGLGSRQILFEQLRAREEHGEEADTSFGADVALDMGAVENEAQEAKDNGKWGVIDVAEEWLLDGHDPEVGRVFDGLGEGCGIIWAGIGVADHIQLVQVDGNESEHGQALLVVEMAEDARNGLFAFGVAENLDKGVGCCWTRQAHVVSMGGLPVRHTPATQQRLWFMIAEGGGDLLRLHGLQHLQPLPQLLIQSLHFHPPTHVPFNHLRSALLIRRRRQLPLMVFYLH